jgi:DNA-binding GntR family transcriptional regulator
MEQGPSTFLIDGGAPGSGAVLGENVYDVLRQEILAGILRPNQALVEAEIAERLVVSRMPVREALHKLSTEGLVRSQRRRWIVHEHTAKEVREIYEMRAALEAEAAALAALRADTDAVNRILSAGEPKLFSAAPTREIRMEANELFHSLFITAAGNTKLRETLYRNATYFHFRLAIVYTQQELDESGEQHLVIAKAIASRNATAARQSAYDHIHHSLAIIERRLL